jgi:hypothetical protein
MASGSQTDFEQELEKWVGDLPADQISYLHSYLQGDLTPHDFALDAVFTNPVQSKMITDNATVLRVFVDTRYTKEYYRQLKVDDNTLFAAIINYARSKDETSLADLTTKGRARVKKDVEDYYEEILEVAAEGGSQQGHQQQAQPQQAQP